MSRKARKQKCNKYRKNQTNGDNYLRVIQGGALERQRNTKVTITPRNFNQDELLGLLEDRNINIVFAVGPAGTGKTLISTLAGIKALKGNDIDKFVVTRPAVSVDEQHGFLPGTLQEKMAPWTRPIMDVFEEYYSPEQIEYMLNDNKVEIAPLAYMRGRTFKNSFIIADEMQNATDSQMKMLLTRIGDNSKIVVTGDLAQHDRGFESNGLKLFIEKLTRTKSDRIKLVQFNQGDIARHPVVDEVLNIYNDEI
jgi:phosphate starvation-inducible PhoH-like protein|tara:strand:+ start:4299 stop:5054 length:756 start_codon:yes stop_codon:yes gene_type:complete